MNADTGLKPLPEVDDQQQMSTARDYLRRVVKKFYEAVLRSTPHLFRQSWAERVCAYLQHTCEQQDQPDPTYGHYGTCNAVEELEVDPRLIAVVRSFFDSEACEVM